MAAKDTLKIYQGALMDQEEMKVADFGKALALCFKLETVDIGGCTHITDEFISHLCNGELEHEGVRTKPGFPEMVSFKMNFLVKIMDGSV
jgi:hypothetical protein